MGRDNNKRDKNQSSTLSQTPQRETSKKGSMKEEISLALADVENLNPKHEPMTKNQREKSESEKTYK